MPKSKNSISSASSILYSSAHPAHRPISGSRPTILDLSAYRTHGSIIQIKGTATHLCMKPAIAAGRVRSLRCASCFLHPGSAARRDRRFRARRQQDRRAADNGVGRPEQHRRQRCCCACRDLACSPASASSLTPGANPGREAGAWRHDHARRHAAAHPRLRHRHRRPAAVRPAGPRPGLAAAQAGAWSQRTASSSPRPAWRPARLRAPTRPSTSTLRITRARGRTRNSPWQAPPTATVEQRSRAVSPLPAACVGHSAMLANARF